MFYRALYLLLLFINGIMGKTYKKTTRATLYRPKTHSEYTYNRFLKQFRDPYTFGINNKQHYHYKDYIIQCLTGHRWQRNKAKLKFSDVETHYQNKGILYYTNHPDNALALYCIDIDPLKDENGNVLSTAADMKQATDYLLTLFPNCYYEPSTSGHGVHFYILIDFEHSTIYRTTPTWGSRANHYICKDKLSLSKLLKLYINNTYSVKYDAIKATYSNYTYSSLYKKYIISNCGTLCKAPRPTTDTAQVLYNAPLFPLSYVSNRVIPSLIATLISNSLIDPDTVLSSKIAAQEMKAMVKGNSLHSSGDSLHSCLNISGPVAPGAPAPLPPPLSSSIISISQHFDNTPSLEVKNEGNAFDRSREFYQDYFREYYKKHNVKPGKETCRQAYRQSSLSTGAEDVGDIERLDATYDFVDQDFKPELLKTSKYVVGEYLEDIKQVITEEQARLIARSRSSYDRKIYYEDIDMATGYYYLNLTGRVEEKYNNNKSLTVPANNLCDWFEWHKEQGHIKNGCGKSKAKASREILQYMEWLELLDDDYCLINHVAQRWSFTEKFPKYEQYLKAVGPDTVARIKSDTKQAAG